MLTPRVSEELMRYQQGEHRGGAPPAHASGRSRSPTADEFVQVLTLFKFHAKRVARSTGPGHAPDTHGMVYVWVGWDHCA
jgi:hypothetical protein